MVLIVVRVLFFFFKQKTADEMRISDWSSDVCSSDLARTGSALFGARGARSEHRFDHQYDVDRLEMGPRKLRVDAARVADIGDEPVETTDVLARDAEKLRALLLALHPLQPLDGRPPRGVRILAFMRHDGGAMLARIDAFAQRLRHVG